MLRVARFAWLACFAQLLNAAPPVQQPNAAVTVQLPTFGVAIDADGVLSIKAAEDPTGALHAQRIAAAIDALPHDVQRPAELRKVSLVKLEQAIRRQLDAGAPPDDAMRCLAGLQRVQYVFCYPDLHDIVIAGPAEGWVADGVGRLVGMKARAPVLLLQDLLVALRAFPQASRERPFIGCTIDPTSEGLARFVEFQRKIPRTISQQQRVGVTVDIAQGVAKSLGLADIRVFGIAANTHMAWVLVEADYRMKRIGIGLELPPVQMTTFISALSSGSNHALERWWFTPDYDCVKLSEDKLAIELLGQGVQLQSEDKVIGPSGELFGGGAKPNKASQLFTTAFTRKYPQLAANSPVFAQLRCAIDLLVAAAFIRDGDLYRRAHWEMELLGNESLLPTQTLATPKQVACAVNPVWKGDRLLMPAGGGVSILPHEALAEKHVQADRDGKLAARRTQVGTAPRKDRWWWD